jgi:hypothetical protein
MKHFALFLMLLSLSVFVLGCAGCTTEKPVTPPAEQEAPGPDVAPTEDVPAADAPAVDAPAGTDAPASDAPEPAVPGDAE